LYPELDGIEVEFGEPTRLYSGIRISTIDINVVPLDDGYRAWKGAQILYQGVRSHRSDDMVDIEEEAEVKADGEPHKLDQEPEQTGAALTKPQVIADLMLDDPYDC
jgi:hypothetical protein